MHYWLWVTWEELYALNYVHVGQQAKVDSGHLKINDFFSSSLRHDIYASAVPVPEGKGPAL